MEDTQLLISQLFLLYLFLCGLGHRNLLSDKAVRIWQKFGDATLNFLGSICSSMQTSSCVGTCFSFPIYLHEVRVTSFSQVPWISRKLCISGGGGTLNQKRDNGRRPNKNFKIVLQNHSIGEIGHYETQISILKSYLESKFLRIFSRTFSRTFFNRTWTWTFFIIGGYENILNDLITLR